MPDSPESNKPAESSPPPGRRRFVADASRIAMAAGLVGGYGMFGVISGRFIYPSERDRTAWQFIGPVEGFDVGDSLAFEAPSGEPINIARFGNSGTISDFIALSSTCPHLGCQVHWEPQNDRFFCPCHNGVFDASGLGVAGPPEGQSLAEYLLRIEDGLLFVRVPTEEISNRSERSDRFG